MGCTVRQGIQVYRSFVIGLILPIVLSGCLTNDSVEPDSANIAPSTTGANGAPKLLGNAPRMVKVGVAYAFHPKATDPEADPLSFSINNKPTWIDFDETIGYLSGIPLLGHEGTYSNIEIIVSDGESLTKLKPFSITVEPTTAPNMPPEIDGDPTLGVIVGETYSFTPFGWDPDGDILTYSIQNKPSWATFNSATGHLSGTPQAGQDGINTDIAITVFDNNSAASLPAFSIIVFAGNTAPHISGTPATISAVGHNYSFTPTALDPTSDELTYSIQNKPVWAQFNKSTGTLSGTPQAGDVGSFSNIEISVSDGEFSDVLPGFTITVNQFNLGSVTLNWVAPTQNEDGTALINLNGYKIYYGTSPGNYSNQITINNPGITSYVIDNLAPDTWYFASKSFNASGMESAYSNQVSRTVN